MLMEVGRISQRIPRHRLSHPTTLYDIRRSALVRQVKARMYQAQLGIRQSSPRVGGDMQETGDGQAVYFVVQPAWLSSRGRRARVEEGAEEEEDEGGDGVGLDCTG